MAIMLSVTTLESMPTFGNTLSGKRLVRAASDDAVEFRRCLLDVPGGLKGGQRAVPAAARQEAHGDATPDHAWKIGGLIYFNPHDPAIWVEQRVGLGYTLNIGNSRAWLLIGMMVAPVIAARFLF